METSKKFLAKLTPEDVGGKARSVIFLLGNGVQVVGCLDDYTPAMIERLAIHGLSQKVGDSAAGYAKDRDFHGAFGALHTTADNLRNELRSNRTGGGTSDLVQALSDLQNVQLDQAQAMVDAMNEEQLSSIKKHAAVKDAIAKIVAKRLKEAAKGAAPIGDILKDMGLLK